MDPETISALIGGGSALGSFAGNILGSTLSFRRQKQLMEHQAALNYKYGQATALNSPSWNRQGLESAGYNPMLAVQNATSGVNSNFAAQSTANEPDYGSSLGSAVANATDVARLNNENKTTDSTVESNNANARRQNAEAANLEAENPFIARREEAEIGKIGAETAKLGAETDNFKAMIENMRARLELDQYLGEMGITTSAATGRYQADKAYNASKYSADKSYQASITHTATSGGNDMLRTLGTIGLGVLGMSYAGKGMKLLKGSGDLVKVVPKFIKFH